MSTLSHFTDQTLAASRVLDFVRAVGIRATNDPTLQTAAEAFARRWPRSPNIEVVTRSMVTAYNKAAVPGATMADALWAGPLASSNLAMAFAAYSQQLALLGRVPNFRRVPLNSPVAVSTTRLSGYFAGAGRPKPLAEGSFDRTTLRAAVAAGIVVVADEVLRFASPGADVYLRDELAGGLAAFLNDQFVDPTNAGVTGVSPASITYGVSATASSTGDPHVDLRELVRGYVADGGELSTGVIFLSSSNASALAIRSGVTGAPVFPNLDVTGGTLAGVPAYASEAVGAQLIMVDAKGVLVADDLGIEISKSDQAAIEMSDTPTVNSATPTATSMVSLYQTNSTALRVERFLNWSRVGAIAVIDGVDYLAEGGSPS